MSDVQREPCRHCGESAAPSLKVCPFCRGSLLVDVVIATPVAEPRVRYLLAREISSLGPPASPFSILLRELELPRPVMARRASRLAALSLSERLADFGIASMIEPAGSGQGAGRSARRFAAAASSAVAGLVLLLWMGVQRGSADFASTPPPSPALATAEIPSWPQPLPPLSAHELSALATPSIVTFRSGDRQVSGFFIAPDLALTRSAAIGDGTAIKVLAAHGGEIAVEVVKRDDAIGLALVRVPGSRAEPLQLGDAAELRGGERVFFSAIAPVAGGSPSSLQEGALGPIARRFQGITHLTLQPGLLPGGDGGPVLDGQGRVLGLVAVQPDGAYLLPINYAYTESHLAPPPRLAPNQRKWTELLAEAETAERLRIGPPR
jgi:serine protease Do